MKILVVDDEELVKNELCWLARSAAPGAKVRGFCNPRAALEEVQSGKFQPNVAFLDIEMSGMSGLQLAKQLKDTCPWISIIFVTAYPHFALEAFALHSQGYLLKPASVEGVSKELAVLDEQQYQKGSGRLYIQCFGNFEVFSYGVPVRFRYAKCKEMLAYLVDRRGAMVSSREMCSILWEDRPDTFSLRGQMRKIFAELKKSLCAVGAEEVLIKRRNEAGVAARTPCDYYSYLRGDIRAINAYHGEYMSNYSWAEMTVGYLESSTN